MTPDEELEQWLAPRSASGTEPTAQELFTRTHGIIRRPVRLRRLGRGLFTVACLAIGYGVGFVSAPTKTVVILVDSPAPVLEVPPLPIPTEAATAEPTAAQLELQAELSDDPQEVAALFRKAGDKYLNVDRDYPRATRSYRMYLQALHEPNPPLQPDDSWLLANLKPQPR